MGQSSPSFFRLPSGKRLHNYGKSPFSMGKSTISMAIFNSYVKLPEGTMELFLMQDFRRIGGEISAEPMAMKQH
jgi:hypothetical protein